MKNRSTVFDYCFVMALLLLFQSNFAIGMYGSPGLNTQMNLEYNHKRLSQILALCGRYPTTSEGFDAIHKRPPDLKCKYQYEGIWEAPSILTDGWGQPMRYTSDGQVYRIDASHGYFVTNSSPEHGHGKHWENLNGGESRPPFGMPSWSYFTFEVLALALSIVMFIARRIGSDSMRVPESVRAFYQKVTFAFGCVSLLCFFIGIFWMPF